MSAPADKAAPPPPAAPPSDVVNVEVDGKACQGRKGQMIIHVTDAQPDAYVPRFCYHDKLPIAANCRMCLVEVEKAPKPLPACATPITEGMKIFTKSPKAIGAQKATMEFLLINHPLDCPICDQGGECELQDLAMGFGRDISRFNERKRVVKDKDLGPLVSTDMTRCIHCTRCVRFTSEIAGIQELGTTGRGENMEIGTYVERAVEHELSGNIIDLCPVGALNSKPFRYRARAWEMTQAALVSPHDGVGTNIFGHVLRGKLMRVVPRPNESINETWIADRDRYSYEGVYSADRLGAPMVREGGEWKTVTWEVALETAAKGLKAAGAELNTLTSSSATIEELYLLSRLTRSLGSANIDHRLRQLDFRDQDADPAAPGLGGLAIAAIDQLDALLVVGSNLRREAPVLAHRVRKAAKRGAKVTFVNPARFDYLFPVAGYLESPPAKQAGDLAAILAAVLDGAAAPKHLASLVSAAQVNTAHRTIATALKSGEKRAVWLGALALRHPAYADLRSLAAGIAAASGATLGTLAEGGNAAGAYLAGAVPHRDAAGLKPGVMGKSARDMLASPHKAYLLFGGAEPWADGLGAEAVRTLAAAPFVVAATPYADDTLKSVAHVLLPIATFAETSGTYVNLEGLWQSFAGAARPLGEARPGWKVLRVLGNLAGVAQFDYQSSQEVREELRLRCGDIAAASYQGSHEVKAGSQDARVIDVPMYAIDAVLRRAPSLQRTREGKLAPLVYGGSGA
ncbi:MAG TPA: NADH-quinone oxidoreductase subunit NuoG [Steroidobacteraceae bacterium]|jgi:NADH-quinone oxidoreductase subunit G|nr:NADH-quinone oxidoreductase subunit NuoG [Steroidobacteraceae bacterium]